MSRSRTVIVVFGLLLFVANAFAEETFDLQRLVDLAVKNSQGIQIAQESVAGSMQKIIESRSLYYPQVSLSASYTRLSLVSEITMPFNGQMQTFKFMSPNNYSVKLSAIEQIFNWGRTKKLVKMSEGGANLARDAVETLQQVTAFQVVPIYYNILFIQEAEKVLDETRRLFLQRLDTLKARYDAGIASDFDLSLIQVQISAIDSQKIDLQNSIRKLVLTYNRIANRGLDEPLRLTGSLDSRPRDAEAGQSTIPLLLNEALSNRVEMKQLQDQESLAAQQVALAKTGNKPSVLAAFTYELRNGFMPYVDQIRGNWTAVLSAAYPVFDGKRSQAQVAQAEIGLRVVQRQRQDLETAIAAEIRQLVSDLTAIAEKIGIEKTKQAHAEKALKIAEERYQKGLISTTDLIDAQNALDNARLSILQLTVNYSLNQYGLSRTVGRKIYRSES